MKSAHGGDIYGLDIAEVLDFSVNTSPLGMPAAVKQALRGAVDMASVYPDVQSRALIAALSEHEGLPGNMIFPGAGGAELIYRFAYALKPRRALIPAPTFSEYAEALYMTGTEIDHYDLNPKMGYELTGDICNYITAGTDAVFICNPNNPTGTVTAPDIIEQVAKSCKAAGATLFIDECFIDFVGGTPSVKPLLSRFDNIIILRALTKNYAMAGVRVGYALSADEGLLRRMEKAGPPWQISAFASAGAIAALSCHDHTQRARELLYSERPRLEAALSELGLKLLSKSGANYLLFEAATSDLRERLIEKGILIRSCKNYRGLSENSCRVAVKLPHENDRLIAALKSVL